MARGETQNTNKVGHKKKTLSISAWIMAFPLHFLITTLGSLSHLDVVTISAPRYVLLKVLGKSLLTWHSFIGSHQGKSYAPTSQAKPGRS
jgi:hypothetical protein